MIIRFAMSSASASRCDRGRSAQRPHAAFIRHAGPVYWPDILESHSITYAATRSFFVSTVSAFLAFIICRAILPLLFYAPHAMSMRSMGLLEASVRKDGMRSSVEKYLKWHEADRPIKVICISGRNLFGSQGPLFEAAEKGQLEVLFPQSDENNPTVKARYSTYKADFRTDTYPTLTDLVREINISKAALKQNARNKIFEHAELCMWRVVLLSNHCLVQNYFPNHTGCHSDSAPVFVFYKEPECPHSYYDTFYQMFELIAQPHGNVDRPRECLVAVPPKKSLNNQIGKQPSEPPKKPLGDQIGKQSPKFAEWVGSTELVNLSIVFTDIIDSARLNNQFGDDSWKLIRSAHFTQAQNILDENRGYLIKTIGDGILAIFKNSVDAINFSRKFEFDPGHAVVRIRIGIHTGQVQFKEGDVFGPDVNLAARISGKPDKGGIWVSDRVYKDWLKNDPNHSLPWNKHVDIELKGFSEVFTLWSLSPTKGELQH